MKDKVSTAVKGKNAMRVGNYNEAIKCYTNALKMVNEEGVSTLQLVKRIHYDLATAYTSLECYKDAINEYKKVIMLSPSDVSAHYNLAIVYQMSNDVDNALGQYQKVLAINPEYRDVKDKLAVLIEATTHFGHQQDYLPLE